MEKTHRASASDTLRAATIGCGRMGAFHSETVEKHAPSFWMPISHLAAIKALAGIEAVACCDVVQSNTSRAQAAFEIPAAYTDALEMFAQEELDIITLATRTPQKPPFIAAALESGIRGLHVEKPLCNTAAELKQLRKKIKNSGAWVTYGCLRRYLPPYQMAHAHIQASDFGPLKDIHIEMGSAPLMWALVHGLDLMHYYAFPAKPVKVQAWFETLEMVEGHKNLIENDPNIIAATILFDNGVTGRIGRTSGDSITLSSAIARLEIQSDGAQVFSSAIPKGAIYQWREKLNWPVDPLQPEFGGSAKPISLLQKALQGRSQAQEEVSNAMDGMFESQSLIFDLLHSHLEGGKIIEVGAYPDDIGILGIAYGNPA